MTTESPVVAAGTNLSLHNDSNDLFGSTDLSTVNIVCLILIIVLGISCNTFGVTFIFRQDAERNLKDKIIAILCIINASQSIGYAIELHAAIKNQSTEGLCEAAAFIVCTLTYSSIGYFVA